MDQKETLTRIRQIIADARLRRGLATDETIADAMLEAMQIAATRRFPPPNEPQTPYPIRRRRLLTDIVLRVKHYGFQEEVDAFVAKAGVTTIHGLTIEQLDALDGWLEQVLEAQQAACDSRLAPPAR